MNEDGRDENERAAAKDDITHPGKAPDPQRLFHPQKNVKIVMAVFAAGILILALFALIAILILPP